MSGAIDAYRQAAGAYSRALSAHGSGRDPLGTADGELSANASTGAPSFADMVQHSLSETIQQQRSTETQAANAVAGRGDLTGVVTSVAESEVALQAVVAVRDRVIEAYKDIMRMPI